ncbi:MAG: thiamine diphosphokinase [Dehalococcoidia bacterium]
MRALVIANGEPPSPALLRALAAEASLVVAADGGARHALAAGLTPDAVVGDLDSVTAAERAAIPASRFHQVLDPNTTDLRKAIAFAIARGATRVDVAAAGGGRADHALANLSVLREFRGAAEVHIADDYFDIRLVEGSATIDADPGTVVSLVAIGRCEGVTTANLRWDLAAYTLEFSPYGVHNEVAVRPARVSVASGDLLLFTGRWVERHG